MEGDREGREGKQGSEAKRKAAPVIARSCIHDLPGFRPQNRCRRSSKRRDGENSGPFFPELDEFHSCEDLPRTLHRGESAERERERKRGNREERTNRGGSGEPIEPRRACNHADGSANISASPPRSRFIFSPPDRERERGREKSPCGDRSTAHTAVTYVVHFAFKQCAETRGNEDFPSYSYPLSFILSLSLSTEIRASLKARAIVDR